MSADLLRVSDLSASDVEELLDDAISEREARRQGKPHQWCAGRRVAFIWDGEGFRNRAAFEIAVAEAGGVGVQVPGRLGEREDISDLAAYLDSWFDAIVVRTPSFSLLNEFAGHARAPVINARTAHNHPCEILGDLAFVRQVWGDLDRLTLMFVGEAANLSHSWCEAAAVLDLTIVQVCPPGYEIDRAWLESLSPGLSERVTASRDPHDAIDAADIIYTDCWPAATDGRGIDVIREQFAPLQISADLIAQARPEAIFLPCPPVTRGQEVTAEAMNSPRCRVVEAKSWLLDAQAALLHHTIATPGSAQA